MFEHSVFGNSLFAWLTFLVFSLAAFALLTTLVRGIVRRLSRFTDRTETEIDDLAVTVAQGTKSFFFLLVALYLGAQTLDLSDALSQTLKTVMILAFLLQGAIWGNHVIAFWLNRALQKRMQEDAASATTLAALGFVSKLLLWVVILLLALDNIGVNITALVTGLGVGGIAVALALQNILGDLFASLSIVLDKPFVLGDFVIVDQHMGTVEHIGLKTTRLRSLSGEQIICSNSDMLKSRIRNYKRMFERRVIFSIGVTYQTSHEQLKKIPEIIRSIVEAREQVRFDRCHFKEYGDFSLNFETVYYVTSPEYLRYMDIQQAINLEIYRQFQEAGIDFAYPTRTLYVSHLPEMNGMRDAP